MPPELAEEIRRYPTVLGEDRILPPGPGATSGRQRADKSFHELLERAEIRDFHFHDLRHTFASWYMMSGGDLYELSNLLGHSNIKMTERYADLARAHIVKTGRLCYAVPMRFGAMKIAVCCSCCMCGGHVFSGVRRLQI
jgi:integrase